MPPSPETRPAGAVRTDGLLTDRSIHVVCVEQLTAETVLQREQLNPQRVGFPYAACMQQRRCQGGENVPGPAAAASRRPAPGFETAIAGTAPLLPITRRVQEIAHVC